jgi:hypothetical protein
MGTGDEGTSLPASLALFIWESNSSLVWHATTTPSSAAILHSSSGLGEIEKGVAINKTSRGVGLQDCFRWAHPERVARYL